MSFSISKLPVVGGKIIRGFRVKSDVLNLKRISLRSGLTLGDAENKLGVEQDSLSKLGITEGGIDVE